jgi:hypothetical protein
MAVRIITDDGIKTDTQGLTLLSANSAIKDIKAFIGSIFVCDFFSDELNDRAIFFRKSIATIHFQATPSDYITKDANGNIGLLIEEDYVELFENVHPNTDAPLVFDPSYGDEK